MWNQSYGTTGNDEGFCVKQTVDGGYIISGWTESLYGSDRYDLLLIKTDLDGNEIWTLTWGGYWNEAGSSVVQTADEGFLVVGWTWSYSNGYSDFLLIKTDLDGNVVWWKNIGGNL